MKRALRRKAKAFLSRARSSVRIEQRASNPLQRFSKSYQVIPIGRIHGEIPFFDILNIFKSYQLIPRSSCQTTVKSLEAI